LSNAFAHEFSGTIISLSSIINTISKDEVTFFDFLENVWSFAMICFGLLLAKASKYCNIQKKNSELSTEKTESQ
jgi:hypothetical protein